MDEIYTFAYRGILADQALDKAGRKRRPSLGPEDLEAIRKLVSYELLDGDLINTAERMSVVYAAIHCFENAVRDLVKTAMTEEHREDWWSKVPSRIQKRAATRMADEAKFRWHGARGGSEIDYCNFGDLSAIIVTNWQLFEPVLTDLEWTKSTLSVLERSRNIVMHTGRLDRQDLERIGMNIRDWFGQVG